MRCPDGSFRNDAGAIWRGTTVFGAIALHNALFYHGRLLSDAEKAEWEDRDASADTPSRLFDYTTSSRALSISGLYRTGKHRSPRPFLRAARTQHKRKHRPNYEYRKRKNRPQG